MMDFTITGEPELIANLNAISQRIQKDVAFESVVIGLQPMIDAARAYAPVQSGSLQRSIGMVVRKYKAGRIVFGAVGIRPGYGTGGNKPEHYAHLVEFGHRIGSRGHKRARRGPAPTGGSTVPPYPFMRPAWDATKEVVLSRIETEFSERLSAVVAQRKVA